MPLQLPHQDPCVVCEGVAGRVPNWVEIIDDDHCVSIIPEYQFEVGQALIVPKRHAPLLTDLTDAESAAIFEASRRLMRAIVAAYDPLGVLLFQNNGVYSGQVTPHYHLHVVPRQPGSDWGVGPPQLARMDGVGRELGTAHDAAGDTRRLARARRSLDERREAADRIRAHL